MSRKLYVCDGKVPGCKKTFCGFNGTGYCIHTEDRAHARYESHDWEVKRVRGKRILVERMVER